MICESSVLGVSGSSFFTLGFASHTSLHLPTKIAKRCTEKSCQCHSSQNSRFVNCSQNFFVFDNIVFEVSPAFQNIAFFLFSEKQKCLQNLFFIVQTISVKITLQLQNSLRIAYLHASQRTHYIHQ